MIGELRLDDQIHMIGQVPSEDLLTCTMLPRCWLTRRFTRAWLTALEAMSCGLPTVVSNVASLPEVVGDAALLIDPNDGDELTVAMWRVLTDQKLNQEMRAKGLRQAERFFLDTSRP